MCAVERSDGVRSHREDFDIEHRVGDLILQWLFHERKIQASNYLTYKCHYKRDEQAT